MHCMKRLKLKMWSVREMYTGTLKPTCSETCEVTFICVSLWQFSLPVCIRLTKHRQRMPQAYSPLQILLCQNMVACCSVWNPATESRQLNLAGARQILGNAIGKAPKDKVSMKYVSTLYVSLLSFNHTHGVLTFCYLFHYTNRYLRNTSRLNSRWGT